MALIADIRWSLLIVPMHDFSYPPQRQSRHHRDLLRGLAGGDVPEDLPMDAGPSITLIAIPFAQLLHAQVAGDLNPFSHTCIVSFRFV